MRIDASSNEVTAVQDIVDASPTSMQFLVVEDDVAVGRLLARLLGAHGETLHAGSVGEALALLGDGRSIHGLIIDVGLPDGSGLEVAARARELQRDVAILIISGSVDGRLLRETQATGAQYLLKPVDAKQLDVFAAKTRALHASLAQRIDEALRSWEATYRLTPTEIAILRLSIGGRTLSDIAQARGVAYNTVRKQVQQLMAKTGDTSLAFATNRFMRQVLSLGT